MKILLSILFGALALFLTIFGAYSAINYATSVVPPGEYAGLIKLAVTCVLILTFGGLLLLVGVVGTTAAAALGGVLGIMLETGWEKFLNQFSPYRRIWVGMKFQETKGGAFSSTITALNKGMATVECAETKWNRGLSQQWAVRIIKARLASGDIKRVN
jgi:hypothetical protein